MKKYLKKTLEILALIYFVLMGVVFPLFIRNGYNSMGTVKFHFFEYAGTMLLVMLFLGVVYLLWNRDKRQSLSVTDWFMLGYTVVVCLSTVSSPFRRDGDFGDAIWGSQGWYMGFVTQMLLVLIYFMMSRFFSYEKTGIYLLLIASSIVFLLGICNRFGFYPIPMEGQNAGFLSTLGNINWYCGYFAVVFPLGFALFLCTRDRRRSFLYGSYLLIGFATGMTQGSDSGFLVLFGLFAAGFLCIRDTFLARRWLFALTLFFLAGAGIGIIRLLFPDRLSYETTLMDLFTDGPVSVIGLFSTLLLIMLLEAVDKRRAISGKAWTILGVLAAGLTGALLAGYIGLVYVNTTHPLWSVPLNGHPAFTFNSDYLNGRGTTWHAGLCMFLEFPLWNRLVGIGPDCFASYAYSSYQGVWELREQFGELILTNAHNEAITLLVNVGLWGLVTFFGAFITLIKRAFSDREKNAALFAATLSVCCYLIHNTVSFAQVINTPTVFLVLGMAEGMLRRTRVNNDERK